MTMIRYIGIPLKNKKIPSSSYKPKLLCKFAGQNANSKPENYFTTVAPLCLKNIGIPKHRNPIVRYIDIPEYRYIDPNA